MAELKALYLFHGGDGPRIDAVRRRVRNRAQEEGVLSTLEAPAGDDCTPGAVSELLANPSLTAGRRYIVADGVEGWKAGELKPLQEAVGSIIEGTTLILLGRGKVVTSLVKMVEESGGEAREFEAPKPWELPEWARASASNLGFNLDREGAEELVAIVGTRLERLTRELEKIATAADGSQIGRAEVQLLASGDAEPRIYELGDALLSSDRGRTLELCEEMRGRGEDVLKLVYVLVGQLRNVLRARYMLESGHGQKEIQSSLRMPKFVAKRVLAQARQVEPDRLRSMLCDLAELEFSIKGGRSTDPGTSIAQTLTRASG